MLNVKKINKKFYPDCTRVIIKPHTPSNISHIKRIIKRVLEMPDELVEKTLTKVLENFSNRHKNIKECIEQNYKLVRSYIGSDIDLNDSRRILLGAYFSCEYSIQSAALFNPSIVPHPNQSGMGTEDLRFILSLRSVGEGHISSIEFREGIIDKNSEFVFSEPTCYAQKAYSLAHLSETDYIVQFKQEDKLCEKVIFPSSPQESNGIEDARFVKFCDDDGSITYYATYTAYNGHNILPKMIETKDFNTFKIFSLEGKFSKNKGMALFPRKINGKYAMISRIDGENLYIMYSDNIRIWEKAELIKEPQNPWEFVQIGNCGSPIETEAGWLLLTHGVGPMREYSIGVVLLDIENPAKIVGNMSEPLLICNSEEREGYVPNVVYSCGSIIHNGNLIIPYAMSDTCSGIAKVSVAEILSNIQKKEISEAYANST